MTEQNKELFLEFVNFCDSQPKDKTIDHSSWATCAVGKFLETRGIYLDSTSWSGNTPELTGLLGTGKVFDYLGGNPDANYYGEFTQLLKQYL